MFPVKTLYFTNQQKKKGGKKKPCNRRKNLYDLLAGEVGFVGQKVGPTVLCIDRPTRSSGLVGVRSAMFIVH